jgi:hypothetical protein
MSNVDYITRAEHDKDIQRLNEADALLSQSVVALERVLRADIDSKIAVAVVAVNSNVSGIKNDLRSDIHDVNTHLEDQDIKYDQQYRDQNRLMYKIFGSIAGIIATGVVSFLVLAAAHVVHLR